MSSPVTVLRFATRDNSNALRDTSRQKSSAFLLRVSDAEGLTRSAPTFRINLSRAVIEISGARGSSHP